MTEDPYLLVESKMSRGWRMEFMRRAVEQWPRFDGARPADVLGILDDQDYDCGAIESLSETHAAAFDPYLGSDVRIALLAARIIGVDARVAVYRLARPKSEAA